MPYIVTTTPSKSYAGRARNVDAFPTRRAVATLDEARRCAIRAVGDERGLDWQRHRNAATWLPEHGGTVGPLPDGTVVMVEPISYDDLAYHVPDLVRTTGFDQYAQLIDAYNAAQS
jgi:hypothetical protein